MVPVSYLSRLAGDGGKRAFLNPPRVLFRPVLPANLSPAEIERTASWPGQTPSIRVADQGAPMKPGPDASIKLSGLPASASQPVVFDQASHLLIQQPSPISQLPERESNSVRMEQLPYNPKGAETATISSSRSVSRHSPGTDSPDLEPAPIAIGILNEVNKSSTLSAQASDSMTDKTIRIEQTGIVDRGPVVPKRESRRRAMTAGQDTVELIQESARQKQMYSMSSANEAVQPHRIFLTPPAPVVPEKSAQRSEKREQRDPDSSPVIHIGTLEVRINPPEPPRKVISSTTSSPPGVAPLAQGFRSFGLTQG
jgi:hypothetical protein